MTELIWDGKYKDGKKVAPVRIPLPFQTIETVNESTRERGKTLDLFVIEYPNSFSSLRKYYPYLIARLKDGNRWIDLTKGREEIEVKLKDQAAMRWCENGSVLTGMFWNYLKVGQKEYDALQPQSFVELAHTLSTIMSTISFSLNT